MRKVAVFLAVFLVAALAMAQAIAPSNPIAYGNFGKAVASCDGKLFVGQPGKNNVEIFSHTGVYIGVISAPVYQSGGFFGEALSVTSDCTTLVVGAKGYDGTGALFVYDWSASSGVYQFTTKKTATGLVSGDEFGEAVAMTEDGTTVFGASYLKNKVSAFARSTSWSEHVVSMPDLSPGDYAGFSLCVAGNDLGIGVPLQFVNGAFGAFYIHRKSLGGAGNWGFVTKITGYERLGYSCAGSGPRFIVGAPLHNFNSLPPGSGFGQGQGCAVSVRRYTNGYAIENIFGTSSFGFAECGASVGISGISVMYGCPYADVFSVDDGVAMGLSRYEDSLGSWFPEFVIFSETPSAMARAGFSTAVGGRSGVTGAPFSSEVMNNAGMAHRSQYQTLLRDGFENGDTWEWLQ